MLKLTKLVKVPLDPFSMVKKFIKDRNKDSQENQVELLIETQALLEQRLQEEIEIEAASS